MKNPSFSSVATANLVSLGLVLLLGACSGRPIPLGAEQGGTVLIPLAGEGGDYATGFASEVTRQAHSGYAPDYDDQRGELIFVLTDQADSSVHELRPRYVTRVYAEDASRVPWNLASPTERAVEEPRG